LLAASKDGGTNRYYGLSTGTDAGGFQPAFCSSSACQANANRLKTYNYSPKVNSAVAPSVSVAAAVVNAWNGN